jgi:hypothetical protein
MSTTAKPLSQIRRAASLARKTFSGGADGRPKIADRCPCGSMTRARAEKRRHRCAGES